MCEMLQSKLAGCGSDACIDADILLLQRRLGSDIVFIVYLCSFCVLHLDFRITSKWSQNLLRIDAKGHNECDIVFESTFQVMLLDLWSHMTPSRMSNVK